MNKKTDLKLFLSTTIGIIGIILLFHNFLKFCAPAYSICLKIGKPFFKFVDRLPYPLEYLLLDFSFSFFFFLSPLGIFLGFKSFKATKQKLAIFAIVLNSINFFFSIFLGWLVYGIARGM